MLLQARAAHVLRDDLPRSCGLQAALRVAVQFGYARFELALCRALLELHHAAVPT